MKISKIYISAFGGLKDFTLAFEDDFTVIFGENEMGKTTVMAFILAMFYGTGAKQKSISASPRVKYTPFDASPMGGRIYFEDKNKEYCLERQFLKSDSTDKVTLTSLDTGESVAVPSDIGTKLFGMGAEAFKSSMFIGSANFSDFKDEAIGDLNARLSSVALTGDENTSFEKINGRVEKAKEKVLSKSGRAGLLYKAKEELKILEERYENAKADAKRKSEIAKEKENLAEKGRNLAQTYQKLKEITDKKDDVKSCEKLKEYLETKAKLDSLNECLTAKNGQIFDLQYISKVKFCLSKLETQKEKCLDIEKDIADIKKAEELENSLSTEEAQKKTEEIKKNLLDCQTKKDKLFSEQKVLEEELAKTETEGVKTENTKAKYNLFLVILGALLVVSGIVSALAVSPFCYILSGVGAVVLLLGFILKPSAQKEILAIREKKTDIKQKIADNKDKSAQLSEQITRLSGEINSLAAVINADRTLKEKRLADLQQKELKLQAENEKLDALKAETDSALGGIIPDEETLALMEKSAEEQKEIKLKLGILSKDLGGISYEEAKIKLEKMQNSESPQTVDFSEAERKKEEIGEEMTAVREKITALETELKTSFRNSEIPEVVEREMNVLLEKIRAYSSFVEACNVANDCLAESFASIRKGYGGELEQKTLENFSRLTGGKYGNLTVSKSLQMNVEDKNIFGMREIDYLSLGTFEQAMLSLRLAICSLIGEKGTTPVMLDDALSNYDDRRTETALEFLSEFSKTNQVLLFTCHKSVVDKANGLGLKTTELKK
ncbi:MAG: AAA family ATPase [Clostridia bacterium]|nr:AAA family ATPase [Clostridia bacterium]